MKRLNVPVPDTLLEAVRRYAADRGQPVAEIMRRGAVLLLRENGIAVDYDGVEWGDASRFKQAQSADNTPV